MRIPVGTYVASPLLLTTTLTMYIAMMVLDLRLYFQLDHP
jgi:hypothetical protein